MRKVVIFLMLIIIPVSLITAFLLFRENPTELEKAWYRHPVKQSVSERIWKDYEFELIAEIEDNLHWPLTITSYDDETFLVADYGDMIVKKFTRKGEFISNYGKGEGRGPGEMLSIMDVKVDSDGNIWVLDNTNLRIIIFNSPDEWELIDLHQPATRLIPADNDQFIVKLQFSEKPEMWHKDESVLKEYEPLVNDHTLWAYIHEGFLENDPYGGIISNFLYTNSFMRYTKDGKIDYFRWSIDPPSIDEIMNNIEEPRHYTDDQTYFFKEMSPFSRLPMLYSGTIHKTEFHTLPALATDEVRMALPEGNIYRFERRFADVYDIKTGDYLYSYQLPKRAADLAIFGHLFIAIAGEDGRISVWRWSEK